MEGDRVGERGTTMMDPRLGVLLRQAQVVNVASPTNSIFFSNMDGLEEDLIWQQWIWKQ